MIIVHRLAAVCLSLALSCTAYADGCYRGTRATYSYAPPTYTYTAPTYVAPYVAPVKPTYDYQPYRFLLAFPLVELPSYGAVYQPLPDATGVPNALQPRKAAAPSLFEEAVIKELKELGKGLKDLGDRVEKIERTRTSFAPNPAPTQPAQPQNVPEKLPAPDVEKAFLDVNKASCAMCHQRGSLAKGTSFVFTEADGSPRFLSADEREQVQFQVGNDMMPQRKTGVVPLTKEGKEVLYRELDRQIALSGKLRSQKKATP